MQGIDQQIFNNRKSISRKITHPSSVLKIASKAYGWKVERLKIQQRKNKLKTTIKTS